MCAIVSLDESADPVFLQMSLPPGASRANYISQRRPRFVARLCLQRCRRSCATSTTCAFFHSMLSYADNQLCNRHGRFQYGRMTKYGLSGGSTRGAMARSRRCTARSGLFTSIVSSGTRRMARACLSAFTPAKLLSLLSS